MINLQVGRPGRLLACACVGAWAWWSADCAVAAATDTVSMAVLEARVQREPANPDALIDLGVALAQQGRLAEARQRFDQALRTSPVHALAHDNLLQLQLNMARHAYAAALGSGSAALPPVTNGLQWSPSHATAPAAASAASAASTATAASAAARAPGPPLPAEALIASAPPAMVATRPSGTDWLRPVLAAAVMLALGASAWAWSRRPATATLPDPPVSSILSQPITLVVPEHERAVPEERLIQVYRLIGQGQWKQAMALAESLVADHPRFTLAQLVYGDLLLAHSGVLRGFGRGTAQVPGGPERQITALQLEAQQRLNAWRTPPQPGTVPRQVLLLPASVRQLVAVDGLRSRLFVLEHRAGHLVVTASLYAAIGRLGVGKQDEGDLRTPLGVYDITGRLGHQQVGDFYGAGALPLSYPNEHDRRLRRTGANIWLHGTRADRHAEAPFSSNGCIVLSNPDMERLLQDLVPRRTPVVIAERLEWVTPKSLAEPRNAALALVEAWRQARMQADPERLLGLYARSFDNGLQGWAEWQRLLAKEASGNAGRERQLLDLTILEGAEGADGHPALFITFREVLRGSASGTLRRQYWSRERGQWKIFSEGVLE